MTEAVLPRQKSLRFSDKLETIEMDSLEADLEFDDCEDSSMSSGLTSNVSTFVSGTSGFRALNLKEDLENDLESEKSLPKQSKHLENSVNKVVKQVGIKVNEQG